MRIARGAVLGGVGLGLAMGIAIACSSGDPASPPATETSDAGQAILDAGSNADANGAILADGSDANADAGDAGVDAGPTLSGYQVLGEVTYPFARPYSLALDSTDHLYVSEQVDAPDTHTLYLFTRSFATNIAPGHARILEFDASGTYLGWIGAGSDATTGFHAAASVATAVYGYDPGAFNMIRGMAFDSSDHLFVLDNWRIQELDKARAFVRWAGFSAINGYGWHATGQPTSYAGPLTGGFTWPSCLRIYGGRLWVGTWYWKYPGFPNGDWNRISALDMTTGLGVGWLGGAIDPGTSAVSAGYFDAGGVDAGGTLLQPYASEAHSTSPGIFSSPRHFVWQGDRIWVVDDTSDPVLSIFDNKGVMQPGKLEHLVGASEKPFAIAVDRFGNPIISDMYTGSIRFFSRKLDPSGEFTQVAEWQVDVASVPNASYPIIADMAWDSAGDLFVAATTKNKVYKVRLTYSP